MIGPCRRADLDGERDVGALTLDQLAGEYGK